MRQVGLEAKSALRALVLVAADRSEEAMDDAGVDRSNGQWRWRGSKPWTAAAKWIEAKSGWPRGGRAPRTWIEAAA
ncbi:hypothetical protein E2562_020537 [Oryza meyeriana var. granulata]|uniref:Uncharacterized protein n=1 Tax=Oryza meyeriana var. granulata TaxID=110450 RepID=A0A6G1EB13_9ORYZ|nr:hypothetical protein E2562_020537 [Oryza meyeriana var. granulata]